MTLYVMLYGMLPFPFVDPADGEQEGVRLAGGPYRSSSRSSHRSSSLLLPAAVIEAAVCEAPLCFPAVDRAPAREDCGRTTSASVPAAERRGAHGPIRNGGAEALADQASATASSLPSTVSNRARELLSAILIKEPARRATLATIAQHRWSVVVEDQ